MGASLSIIIYRRGCVNQRDFLHSDLLNAMIHSRQYRFQYSRFHQKILTASRDIPRFLSISFFFSLLEWNVNRGRDILQRGHEVRECGISLNLVPRDEIEKRKSGDRFQI